MDISRINFISDSNISKKTVLLRVDLNLPFKNNKVTDSLRIERILDTINFTMVGELSDATSQVLVSIVN